MLHTLQASGGARAPPPTLLLKSLTLNLGLEGQVLCLVLENALLGLGQHLFDLFDLLNLGQGYDFFSSSEISRKIYDFLREDLFFWRTLAHCVVGSWPWPPAFLSLASSGSVLGKLVLGLGLGFFYVVSHRLKSCVLNSISSKGLQTSNLYSDLPNLANLGTEHKTSPKSNHNPTSEKGAEI